MTEITAQIETITPALAKEYLALNKLNRPVRMRKVKTYARDMAAGEWAITGEAIKFDTNGNLMDGQHRLYGVIESGATVQMLVVRGVAPEAQGQMDAGARRTPADALSLRGIKNASGVAAIARLALSEPDCGFVDTRTSDPTHAEVAKFVEDHYDAINRAAELAIHYYKSVGTYPSSLGVALMRTMAIDVEATIQWIDSISNMVTDGRGDPRSAYLRRIQTSRRNSESIGQYGHTSLLLRCWNDWRKGKHVEKYSLDTRSGAIKIPTKLH